MKENDSNNSFQAVILNKSAQGFSEQVKVIVSSRNL